MVLDLCEPEHLEKSSETFKKPFHDLLETIDLIAITLDERGDLTFCNNFFFQLTGWRQEEILGHDWNDLFTPPRKCSSHECTSQLLQRPIPTSHESHILTKHGIPRLISWSATTLFDKQGERTGTALIGHDITETRRIEEALRTSEEKFRQMAVNVRE